MTTESDPAAIANKKKKDKSAKKKRKISKHILQANKDNADLDKARASESLPLDESAVDAVAASALTKTSSKPDKPPPGAANTHTKDIKEAAGYLTNWKKFRAQWKFNKNTQSWLIRHMYESDKVAKGHFVLLMEYLQGLQGTGAKERIAQEATRRALRYKEFEEGGSDNKHKEEAKKKAIKFAEDTKEAAPVEGEDGKTKKKKKPDPTASEDERRWNELDEHDKRKEYKRARKILDTLKVD